MAIPVFYAIMHTMSYVEMTLDHSYDTRRKPQLGLLLDVMGPCHMYSRFSSDAEETSTHPTEAADLARHRLKPHFPIEGLLSKW